MIKDRVLNEHRTGTSKTIDAINHTTLGRRLQYCHDMAAGLQVLIARRYVRKERTGGLLARFIEQLGDVRSDLDRRYFAQVTEADSGETTSPYYCSASVGYERPAIQIDLRKPTGRAKPRLTGAEKALVIGNLDDLGEHLSFALGELSGIPNFLRTERMLTKALAALNDARDAAQLLPTSAALT